MVLKTSSSENRKHPSTERSSVLVARGATVARSSMILALPSISLYWSCAK